jgi:Uma2 family endonuclease
MSRLKKTFLDGPADLVVEIISRGSGAIDRGDKYFEYEEGGVREYWLIDPRRKQAKFYQFGRDKRFPPITDGVFQSAVLKGLWLEVAWMWQKPLPSAPDIWEKWNKRA